MGGAKFTWILVAAIVVVFGAVLALHWEGEPEAPAAAPAPAVADARSPAPEAPRDGGPARTPPPPKPVTSVQPAAPAAPTFTSAHEAEFRDATDYLEFARSMLPKALEGDRDAQFQLYRALDYCRRGYREYFDRGQKRFSLDEALREAATLPRSDTDELRRIHTRCQKLMADDSDELVEGERWLNRAAAGRHPRAQVELAGRLVSNSLQMPAEQATRSIEEARRLAREALASRDPASIWRAGELSALRENAAGNDYLEGLAWWQAACDRGLDCGPGSERVRQLCGFIPNCQSFESVEDILRRSAQDPGALEARARQINALIDARDWQALGFGGPR